MRTFLTLVRRELGGFFVSLTGYVIIASVLLLLGFSFTNMLAAMNGDPNGVLAPLTELFYSTLYFWLIVLLTAPVITMRSFALEKWSGTYETLMTAPVSDWQVVLAKFTGTLLFYMLTWLPVRLHRGRALFHPGTDDSGSVDDGEHVFRHHADRLPLHVDGLFCVVADAQPDHRGDEQFCDRVGIVLVKHAFARAGAGGGLGGEGVFLHIVERAHGGLRTGICRYAARRFLPEPDGGLFIPDVEGGGKPPLEVTWRTTRLISPVFRRPENGPPSSTCWFRARRCWRCS